MSNTELPRRRPGRRSKSESQPKNPLLTKTCVNLATADFLLAERIARHSTESTSAVIRRAMHLGLQRVAREHGIEAST
jgi:hypothetical protein